MTVYYETSILLDSIKTTKEIKYVSPSKRMLKQSTHNTSENYDEIYSKAQNGTVLTDGCAGTTEGLEERGQCREEDSGSQGLRPV